MNLALALVTTIAAGTGSCEFSGDPADEATKTDLLHRFSDADQSREWFMMQVDKSALGLAEGHVLVLRWTDDSDLRVFRGGIEGGTATSVDNDDGTTTYTFSGGSAWVREETGKPNEGENIGCPNLDAVTVTVPGS